MAEEETKESQPKKSGKLLLVLAIIIPLNIVLLLGILFITGAISIGNPSQNEKPAEKEQPKDKKETSGLGPLVNLENFIVNIEDEGEGTFYLKSSLTIELTNEAANELYEKSKMIIRNEVLMILSSLDKESMRGVKNKKSIQTRLQKSINARLNSNIIKNVYFTEFVTQ